MEKHFCIKGLILFVVSGIAVFNAYAGGWHDVKELTIPSSDLIMTESVPYRLGEYTPQISLDIDSDGFREDILFIDGGGGFGIEFTKSANNASVVERIYTDDAEEWDGGKDLVVRLHDFDGDNIPEIIVTYDCDGIWHKGYVFRMAGAGVDVSCIKTAGLKGWISNSGEFAAPYGNWWAEGNILRHKTAMTGDSYSALVYLDGKLRKLED